MSFNSNMYSSVFDIPEKITIMINMNSRFNHFSEVFNLYPNYNKITDIYCKGEIYELPVLPKSLKYLHIEQTKITKLPELPCKLEILSCEFNNLSIIPKLPPKLKNLNCSNNKIIELPELPPALEKLDCYNNKLTELPDLPISLKNIDCEHNKINKLPDLLKFNKNIKESDIFHSDKLSIDCSYNNITELPYYNPRIVTIIYDDNPIDEIIYTYFNKCKEEWYLIYKTRLEKCNVEKLEEWFLECKFNPKYKYCRRMLKEQYDNGYAHYND